jgi:hypothetical protein
MKLLSTLLPIIRKLTSLAAVVVGGGAIAAWNHAYIRAAMHRVAAGTASQIDNETVVRGIGASNNSMGQFGRIVEARARRDPAAAQRFWQVLTSNSAANLAGLAEGAPEGEEARAPSRTHSMPAAMQGQDRETGSLDVGRTGARPIVAGLQEARDRGMINYLKKGQQMGKSKKDRTEDDDWEQYSIDHSEHGGRNETPMNQSQQEAKVEEADVESAAEVVPRFGSMNQSQQEAKAEAPDAESAADPVPPFGRLGVPRSEILNPRARRRQGARGFGRDISAESLEDVESGRPRYNSSIPSGIRQSHSEANLQPRFRQSQSTSNLHQSSSSRSRSGASQAQTGPRQSSSTQPIQPAQPAATQLVQPPARPPAQRPAQQTAQGPAQQRIQTSATQPAQQPAQRLAPPAATQPARGGHSPSRQAAQQAAQQAQPDEATAGEQQQSLARQFAGRVAGGVQTGAQVMVSGLQAGVQATCSIS